MNKTFTLIILAAVLGLLPLCSAEAQIDQNLKNSILAATDDALLIETIQKPGVSADDFFIKMIACKRLAVYGTEKAVPALSAMLSDAKLNHPARYALESMPFAAAQSALIKGATELDGICGIGCVDSVGALKLAEAVPMLKEKFAKATDPKMRKAIFVALGYIGNEDATAFLMSTLKNGGDKDAAACRGLADALLNCAEYCEAKGDFAEAIVIYDALVNPVFPVFAQKAASYHAILARKANAAELLVSKMFSEKKCCFTGGLKTIREFAAADAVPVVKALIASLEKINDAQRVALIIEALGERTDTASKDLLFPVLKASVKSNDLCVELAAIAALGNVDEKNAAEALDCMSRSTESEDAAQRKQVLDAMVAAAVKLPGTAVDDKLGEISKQLNTAEADVAVAFCKIIELRRIAEAAPFLVTLANTEGINASVRYAALNALADIVTLNKLNLLVEALATETDDGKASWILRSACTRLPREDCAARIIEQLNKTKDTAEQMKMLTLLMQIGGQTALARVVDACWNPDTVDAASQVLGKWNTPEDIEAVADACLKLAKESKENKYAVRGIRSYIRVPRQFDLPVATKFQMCRTAFDTAKRPEDKVLIFEVFKRIIEVDSAVEAFSYAKDPAYFEPASEAVVAIALKFQGQSVELFNLLKQIVATSKNEQTRKSAQSSLDRFAAFDKNAPLEIISAIYGADKQVRNVTDLVKARFNGKCAVNISGYNETFTDVAPGIVKTLTIVVKFKETGETRTLTFQENQALVLPEK